MLANIDGYKMIYFTENLLRDFVKENFPENQLPEIFKREAIQTAIENGFDSLESYRELLQFTHLGQLVDLIKSKSFQRYKPNLVGKVNIGPLIYRRNTIMHSRSISPSEIDEIKNQCDRLINSLNDDSSLARWEKFLTVDIDEYKIPQVFVEYPIGKNFEKLVGRSDELKNIKNLIRVPMPVSIIGHGGLGKTALVLQTIEDLMYSPQQPFDKIYFMSFKNTVFENGTIQRFEKVISNHNDLIIKLAIFMGIHTIERDFNDIESDVWQQIFTEKSLLILDNLETEIVRSNLAEFTEIADRFLRNFTNPSRLIITSRYGLGDRERKYPLQEFDLDKTKELVSLYTSAKNKFKGILSEDWNWIQNYSQGNPSLIISFCNTFNSTNKSVMDLRVEYESKYSAISRELHDKQVTFLEFCFENTIDSMPKESQIFLSCLCYICLECNLHHVSEGLLNFLVEDLKIGRLGEQYLRAANFVNIGFLKPIPGGDRYYVSNLVLEYMDGNYSNNNVFSVLQLKSSEWFNLLTKVIANINTIQFDEEHLIETIVSKLYIRKFKEIGNSRYILQAFLSDPSVETLILYYEKSNSVQIINNLALLDKIKPLLLNKQYAKQQNHVAMKIILALQQLNHQIGQTTATVNFRQRNLIEYFNLIQNKFYIFKENQLKYQLREQVCELLVNLNRPELAESFLPTDLSNMPRTAFKVYSKLVGNLARQDMEKCNYYVEKCDWLLINHANDLSVEMTSKYFIFYSRALAHKQPESVLKIADVLDAFKENPNSSVYSLYLESLLIRAECLVKLKKPIVEVEKYLNLFRKELSGARYKKLYPKKKESLEKSLELLERKVCLNRSKR